jgi:hypothetical protein
MCRRYEQILSQRDGSSSVRRSVSDPTSPAQTPIPSANQANEPERMEIGPLS